MAYPVYTVYAGDVLPIFFATYAGSTGASATLTGLAVTDIEIYKDGSATQRSSDAGYTLLDTDGIDFDGITGIHGFSIDTGDNTDSGFYTVGAWFHVVVSAVTVDSQTVNFIAAAFRLLAAESVAGKAKVDVDAFGGTAGTFSSGRPEVNASHIAGSAVSTSSAQIGVNVVNFGGSAGTFASGRPEVNTTHWKGTAAATVDAAGYPVVTIKDGTGQGELATTSGAVDTVTTLTNAPSDSSGVTTLLSRLTSTRAGYLDNLSAGAVATASVLASVASDVTTLLGRITSSLFSGITSMAQWLGLLAGKQTGNSTARTEIRATGAGSGTYDETTDSQEALRDRGDAAWTTATGFSTLDAAGVRSAVGLASANLDTQLAALPTAAENADAVYDEAMSGHTTAGTFGDRLRAHLTGYLQATVAGTPSTTSIPLNGSTGIDGGAPNSNNDFYNGRVIIFISGNAAGQATDIADYDGASTTLTVTALAIAPAAADKAIIV